MLRKGMAATTVRDVAQEMGTSSGLIHHYYDSMDELLAEAFERAASQDLEATRHVDGRRAPTRWTSLRIFFGTYARAEQDWAFQLWLDAWAEAGRRPAVQSTSRRLNVAWQELLEDAIDGGDRRRADGVRRPGRLGLADPVAARRAGACRRSRTASTSTGTR